MPLPAGPPDDDSAVTRAPAAEPSAGSSDAGELTGLEGFEPEGLVVERKLGAGGMGEVYVALDSRLGRRVALKVLSPVMADDPQRLARFEREARAVAALNHPSIVTVHSVGESRGIPYLTMELVEGRSLKEQLREEGLPISEAIAIAQAIADALAAAHGRGIVHRDLKPANVMVSEAGRVKVLDFGLAKQSLPLHPDAPDSVTDLTQDGHVLGTIAYMSPEQAEGKAVDARSDLFSFGVMLYEMVAGRRPFDGPSWLAQITALLRDQPEPLDERRADCPPRLARLVDRCLEKRPESRPPTAAEVLAELQAIRRELEHRELLASTGSVSLRLPKGFASLALPARAGRWRWVAAAALTAIALTAALLTRDPDPSPGAGGPQRLVVVPFANAGPEADAFFASGLTRELTRRFGDVPDLRPVARTSADGYAGSSKKAAEIARELEVDWVLAGSVERRGTAGSGTARVRIEARLHRGSDGALVWEEVYDRELAAIFRVQADVVRQVASHALGRSGTAVAATEERPTADLAAYEAFLAGTERLGQPDRARETLLSAIADFERATALDPALAVAWAQLSRTHSALHHWSYDLSPARLEAARAAADRALELQPFLPEAHLARGLYFYWGLRDYASALDELQIAREARPNDAEILTILAWIRQRQGHFDEVLALFGEALELNPRDPTLWNEIGATCWMIGRYDDAERHFTRSIAIAPAKSAAYHLRAWTAIVGRGDLAAAKRDLDDAPDPRHPVGLLVESFRLWLSRDFRGLLAFVDTAPSDSLSITRWYTPLDLVRARAHEALGERSEARRFYERARIRLESDVDARPQDDRVHAALALTYAGLGRAREAVREAKVATELFPVSREAHEGHLRIADLAEVYARVGDADAALSTLETLLAGVHLQTVAVLRLDPSYDGLRADPRFDALLRRGEWPTTKQ